MKKLSLANTPTRIEEIQLMDADLPAHLYIKRDDMTGVGFTGNKIRKLEYLFQKALAVSYTHLTLPTIAAECRSRWSPYH